MLKKMLLLIIGILPMVSYGQESDEAGSSLTVNKSGSQLDSPVTNNVLVSNTTKVSLNHTQKGRFVLSGSSELNCSSQSPSIVSDDVSLDGNTEKYSFNFSPELSYFVIDDLAAGVFINYTSTEYGDFKQNHLTAGPRVTYFFGDGMIKPYLKSDFYFGTTSFDSMRYRILGFGTGGGAVVFITYSIAVNVGISYSRMGYTDVNNTSNKNAFGGVDTDLGISLYF